MLDTRPVARGSVAPVDAQVVGGWLVSGRRSGGPLTLTDLAPLAKVAVRADRDSAFADALAIDVGRAARCRVDGIADDVLVTRPAPGEWLVLAAPGVQQAVIDWASAVGAGGLVTVVDLTHGRALMRLTGACAAAVLAKECAVDLSDRGCPDQRALRTAVARLAVDVVRDDVAGVASYVLHCERSSGQYLFDVLLDAGAELGIDIDGFRPPEAQDVQARTSRGER